MKRSRITTSVFLGALALAMPLFGNSSRGPDTRDLVNQPTCQVHGTRLITVATRTIYGLPEASHDEAERRKARTKLFPNSIAHTSRGCITSDEEAHLEWICVKCLEAELEWELPNPDEYKARLDQLRAMIIELEALGEHEDAERIRTYIEEQSVKLNQPVEFTFVSPEHAQTPSICHARSNCHFEPGVTKEHCDAFYIAKRCNPIDACVVSCIATSAEPVAVLDCARQCRPVYAVSGRFLVECPWEFPAEAACCSIDNCPDWPPNQCISGEDIPKGSSPAARYRTL